MTQLSNISKRYICSDFSVRILEFFSFSIQSMRMVTQDHGIFYFQITRASLTSSNLRHGEHPSPPPSVVSAEFCSCSPSSVIPSTFGGLHTVYASCSLPEPCFFTVLTPAAKRKRGPDNPLWLPKLLPLNEHILLPGVKLIPVIPESNRSSKEFCAPQRAKIAMRLGFTDKPEFPP